MEKYSARIYVKEIIEKYDLKYPLDIWSFIDVLGFKVKFVDTGDSDAYTIVANGKKLILLNKNIKSKKRINFTLAHELGHYFIPNHLEPLYECKVNEFISTKSLNDNKQEKEADLFASELLLPSSLIEKNNSVNSFENIIEISEKYNVSIPAAAIKIIEHTDDIVCFICCENNRISWYIASEYFNNNIRLKDITRTSVPQNSNLNECIDINIRHMKNNEPAFIWIDDVDDDIFIEEEIIYYPEYNTGYLLIKADSLIDYDNDSFY